MGMDRHTSLEELNGFIESYVGWKNISMIELGTQILDNNQTGKEYFSYLGVNHISIDWNDRDGALPLDLSSEIKDIPQADVVTNFGTSEHILDQFMCWKNIHNFCKNGGIIFAFVPPVGTWPDHCDYYYTMDFFHWLAKINNYKILKNEMYEKGRYKDAYTMLMCVLQKTNDDDFKGINHSALLKNPEASTSSRT